jgi:predicted signal transduction protein with EAL and GGDEF domain
VAPAGAHRGSDLHLSASVGVAIATSACDPDSLLRDADAAMYHAKRRGRGRFELFGAPLRDEALRPIGARAGPAAARSSARSSTSSTSPSSTSSTDAVVSYEALLRWTHPERGRIAPDEFIGIAEDSGLMLPMGRWVLRTACAEAGRWPAGVGVGVNLSARQVADPDLCDHVRGALADTGLDPHGSRSRSRIDADGGSRGAAADARGAPRDGRPARARRLRNGLLLPLVPAALRA